MTDRKGNVKLFHLFKPMCECHCLCLWDLAQAAGMGCAHIAEGQSLLLQISLGWCRLMQSNSEGAGVQLPMTDSKQGLPCGLLSFVTRETGSVASEKFY